MCPALSPPVNGTVICANNDYMWASTCEFDCDEGYHLVGHQQLTCNGDGSSVNGYWGYNNIKVEDFPTCECKYLKLT